MRLGIRVQKRIMFHEWVYCLWWGEDTERYIHNSYYIIKSNFYLKTSASINFKRWAARSAIIIITLSRNIIFDNLSNLLVVKRRYIAACSHMRLAKVWFCNIRTAECPVGKCAAIRTICCCVYVGTVLNIFGYLYICERTHWRLFKICNYSFISEFMKELKFRRENGKDFWRLTS